MAKLTTTDISNITGAESTAIANINNNFAAVETAMENTLSLDGTSPNQMGADLDMNDNDILNAGTVSASSLVIDGTIVSPSEVVSINPELVGIFDNVSDLVADITMGYSASTIIVSAGDVVTGGFYRYEVAASGASDHHLTTAGGVKLYVLSQNGRCYIEAFNPHVDGVNDDTSIIQAAVNSLASGIVLLSTGVYLCDSITLKEGVAIHGATDGSTTLKARSNSINFLTMEATSATKTHVDIRNIKFDGNSKTNVTAIYLNGVSSSNRISYIRLKDLHVYGCNEGLHLYYCANTNITDCFVTNTAYGIHLDMCADTDVVATKVQNGSNAGFYVVGGSGAYDEGIRLIGCSTNGQQIGLWVDGQEWGIAEGCSFTTAPGGAALFSNSCSNWKLNGCEFAVAGGTPAAAGLIIGSSCTDFIVSNSLFALNTFGVSSSGTRVAITSSQFKANSNVDIYLNAATKSVINSNICDSTGVAWSILESGAADYNAIGLNVTNGTVTVVGANSAASNNIVY